VTLHRNPQRLLEPLAVVNPYAGSLTFADATVRARRDHVRYLTLISAVTHQHQHQHQHQREVKGVSRGGTVIRYVEATRAGIALAAQVLARSLDELPPGTRRLWTPCTATSRPGARRRPSTVTRCGLPSGSSARDAPDTVFWLDEAGGLLLLIPQVEDGLVRVELREGSVLEPAWLVRDEDEDLRFASAQPGPEETLLVLYERGMVCLESEGSVHWHVLHDDLSAGVAAVDNDRVVLRQQWPAE
jgi:hypothetical protein